MDLKKRILSCLLLLLFLTLVYLIGCREKEALPVMGNARGLIGRSASLPADEGTEKAAEKEADRNEERKKIALTFDDGPHSEYTRLLLKGLREREVKVTFFVTGENAALYPEVVKEIYDDGHLIGNHTYSHIQLTAGNAEVFKEELIRTNEVIREVTGQDTIYVRPPYGSWNKEFEKELNMFPVLWTIDPLDWCSSNAACIADTVCAKTGENDIILMHDQYKTTVTAAFAIIDALQERGYEFVTVDELLFD